MKPQAGVGESRKKMLKTALFVQGGFLLFISQVYNMDKLQECAKIFEKLIDKKYYIKIGRKGKSTTLEITFEPADFYHLIGLHKLKDIEAVNGNRETIFQRILAGRISFSDLNKSEFFEKIENRIEFFIDLENILDDNRLVFKYHDHLSSFSLIKAEYLLSTSYKSNEIYIFIDRKGIEKQFFCRSFFPKEYRDYTIGQPEYTLLYKEKITISTGEKEIQYDHHSKFPKETLKKEELSPPVDFHNAKEIFQAAIKEAARRNEKLDNQQTQKIINTEKER